MNTFFNIAQECSNSMIVKAWGNPCGLYVILCEQRQKMLRVAGVHNLHERITRRGYREQYNNKMLSNYYGSKRLSRSHVFTGETICKA